MGERVILSNEAVPREIGVVKTIGTQKVNNPMVEEDFGEQ